MKLLHLGHTQSMKIAVLTSGGDSPGMNAAIRAVVRQGISNDHAVFGFVEGYRGLADGEMIELNNRLVSEIIDRGGTFLRTSRYIEFTDYAVQQKAVDHLKRLKIDSLIVIGGEGSMQGAHQLCKLGVRVVGVPASIDNDIYGTDYAIGFDTALNTVVEMLSKLRDTASAHERIFVVEVMGRRSGAIALNAGLAGGADYMCLPGTPAVDPDQIDRISALIERRYELGKTHTLIIVAEGAGSAGEVAGALRATTGREVRVTVLGHIQRGGSPSALDRLLASQLGSYAVDLADDGKSDIMVGLSGRHLTVTPLEETFTKQVNADSGLYQLAKVLA